MKQKLLLFNLLMLLFTVTLKAQQTWDFSTWSPNATGLTAGTVVVIDNIELHADLVDDGFGVIDASSNTFDPGGPDEFSSTQRLKTNGSSGTDPASGKYIPDERYLRILVTGPCNIKVWCKSGGSSQRTIWITDDTSKLGEQISVDGDSSPKFVFTGTYSGSGGNIYISGDNNWALYKIEVDQNVETLGFADKSIVSTNIKSVGNRIYVSNVKTSTEVNIYSITGALVKSFKTNTDTDFSFKSGLWIATVKTVEGQKSVKLVTH